MNPPSQVLETAFQHHMNGQLDQARLCYEQVLVDQDRHGAALHGLAMIACAEQRFEQAVPLAEHAVEVLPTVAQCYNTLGISYDATGQRERALQAFQEAVTLKPDHAEAHHNMGVSLQGLHRFHDAIDQCKKAIDLKPKWVRALVTMAQCYQALEDKDRAADTYEQVMGLDPSDVASHVALAELAQELGRLDCAAETLKRLLTLLSDAPSGKSPGTPRKADVHTSLGIVLRKMNQDEEARDHYLEALRLNPESAAAHNNLGNLLNHHKQFEEALHHYEKATQLSETFAEGFNNRAAALLNLDRHDEAATHCEHAIRLKPEYAEAHNTLATALMRQGNYHRAIETLNHGLTLDPEYAEAHSNLGMMHLALGEFDVGWREYQWRLKTPLFRKRHCAPQPRWDGRPFPGKTLLVHCEQGFGDSIQFIRYLPKVKALGGTVLYQDRPPLDALFRRFPGIDHYVNTKTENVPPFDIQVSVMSLPYLFGTEEHNIPAPDVYLKAEVDKILRLRPHIQSHDFNVGIVWAGSKAHLNNRNRSCDPALFQTLAQCPDIGLYGLQRPDGESSTPESLESCIITNLGEQFHDFSDTAGAIAHMDLVITVDTSVLHLACAMGKPTWGLIPHVPDWRWRLDGASSPWYSQLRLFRQEQPGQWQPVFEAITEALNHTLQLHRSS